MNPAHKLLFLSSAIRELAHAASVSADDWDRVAHQAMRRDETNHRAICLNEELRATQAALEYWKTQYMREAHRLAMEQTRALQYKLDCADATLTEIAALVVGPIGGDSHDLVERVAFALNKGEP